MNLEIIKDGMKKALSRACRKKILDQYDADTQINVVLGADEGDVTQTVVATFIDECRAEYRAGKDAIDALDSLEILTDAKNDVTIYSFSPVKIKSLIGKDNIDECLVDYVKTYLPELDDYQALAVSSYLQGVCE